MSELKNVAKRIKEISSFHNQLRGVALHFHNNGDGTMTFRRPNPFVVPPRKEPKA